MAKHNQGVMLPFLLLISTQLNGQSPPGTPIWNIADELLQTSLTIESEIDQNIAPLDFSGIFSMLESITQIEFSTFDQLVIFEDAVNNFSASDSIDISAADELNDTLDDLNDIALAIGIPITSDDINPAGFSITTPGSYYLAENVLFEPNANNLAAITITVENVHLDLRGRTLSTDSTTGTIGIQIDVDDISIENGAIENTDGPGIYTSTPLNRHSYINLRITNSASSSGMEFERINRSLLQNLYISDCALSGINFTNRAQDCTLLNCQSINNTENGYVGDIRRCCISNCAANNNGSDGFACTSGNRNSIDNCTAWSNSGDGFILNSSDSAIYNSYAGENTGNGITVSFNQCIISNNFCEQNNTNNILVSGIRNFIGFNTLLFGSNFNLQVTGDTNAILGNVALAANLGDNYDSTGSTVVIGEASFAQNGAFPMPNPTSWVNLSISQ